MKSGLPLANMLTLGVRDFGVEREFYRRFGWPLVFDSDDFSVFEMRGAVLALFPVEKLAADARSHPEGQRTGIGFSMVISVAEPGEVDELVEQAREAGATITKEPVEAEFFAGRDAYFADPEGNFWEVVCGPPDHEVSIAVRRAAGLAA